MLNIKIEADWNNLLNEYQNGKRLNADDIILLLLRCGNVSGKTMMQKQVFLAIKEVFNDNVFDALFHPDKFGPYSQLIADIILKLRDEGKIRKLNIGESHATYSITEKGEEYVNKIIKNKNISNEVLKKLKENKSDWDEWDVKGILRYVYRNYSEYATKTAVPELKWE